MKAFCKDCKHFSNIGDYYCKHPTNLKDTYYEQDGTTKVLPKEKNANNDCPDFEKSEDEQEIEG